MCVIDHHAAEVSIHAFLCGAVFCSPTRGNPVADLEQGCRHLEALGEAWRRWWMGATYQAEMDYFGGHPLCESQTASSWTHLLAEAMQRWESRIKSDFADVILTVDTEEDVVPALIAVLGAVERMLACSASCIMGYDAPGTREVTKALSQDDYFTEWHVARIEPAPLKLPRTLLDTIMAAVSRSEASELHLTMIMQSREMRKALETAGRGVARLAGQREPQHFESIDTTMVNTYCLCLNKLAAVFFSINERGGGGDPVGAAACALTQLAAVGAAQPPENEITNEWLVVVTAAAKSLLRQPDLVLVVGAEDLTALESLSGGAWENDKTLVSKFNELMEAASSEDWRRNPDRLVARAHALATRPTCSNLQCSEVSWANLNLTKKHAKCSRCLCVRYCRTDCQFSDWPWHRRACRELERRRLIKSEPET